MIAFLEAKKAGLFTKKNILPNLIAGLIVSIIAVPLGMAFAIASSAKPEQGIYTAIVAGFFVSVFGGSRIQIAGPTGAFIVLLASISAKYGISGLQLATLMAGIMLIFMGLAKFGGVIKFIPKPVIVGFTAGIGVVIWVGQWSYFFGLPPTGGEYFHEKIFELFQAFPHLHLPTLALALVSLLTIILFPKIFKNSRIPSPLVAMVLATSLQVIFQFEGVATIGNTFGGIPQTLPSFSIPSWTIPQMVDLIGPAFTIAMLGAIESLLSAVVADGMTGTKSNSNQELIGQGIANIATPLFAGIAATGAIARTATNAKNGGNSPLAGIFHCFFLVIILLFLAPLADNIPLSCMAAILFVVAYNMSDIRQFSYVVQRAPRVDVIILLVTFFLTIFADLVVAVNVGVMLAIFYFIQRMTSSVEVYKFNEEELYSEPYFRTTGKLPKDVVVYAIQGPLFFGAVEHFAQVLASVNIHPKIIIIRLHYVPFTDITAIGAFTDIIKNFNERGVHILLSEANYEVKNSLHKSGILTLTGRRIYWKDFTSALKHCEKILAEENNAPIHHVEFKDGQLIKHYSKPKKDSKNADN